jgi:hypothetical protein
MPSVFSCTGRRLPSCLHPFSYLLLRAKFLSFIEHIALAGTPRRSRSPSNPACVPVLRDGRQLEPIRLIVVASSHAQTRGIRCRCATQDFGLRTDLSTRSKVHRSEGAAPVAEEAVALEPLAPIASAHLLGRGGENPEPLVIL